MAFMQKQVTEKTLWWVVETTHGTEFLPFDLIGKEPADSEAFRDYCEGDVLSWEQREGCQVSRAMRRLEEFAAALCHLSGFGVNRDLQMSYAQTLRHCSARQRLRKYEV
jgi:hypothetical protein